MMNFKMTINGKSTATNDTLAVINPATEQAFERSPNCSDQNLDDVVDSAQRAFRTWSRSSIEERRTVLKKCSSLIMKDAELVARVLTMEQGKTFKDAFEEVKSAARWFDAVSEFEIKSTLLTDDKDFHVELEKRAIGVVAAITPWNFPIILGIWKAAPALLAGNCVVIKPSPYTPLSALYLGQIVSEAFPPGVLSVIAGDDSLGQRLVRHSGINKIAFTGSTRTGKKIFADAANDLKRITLELGGNDAAIVMKSVNPIEVARKLFWASFRNCGQVCVAIKRLYVHQQVFNAVVEEMKTLALSVKIGDGLDPETQMGPVNNMMQLTRAAELVADARNNGGTILVGGQRVARSGYFFPPTLIVGVDRGSKIVDEEQFCPVLPVIPFSDLKQVVESANATEFGLGASIWSDQIEEAQNIARQLESGTVWINHHGKTSPYWPFGGTKWSGFGYENGLMGLEQYLQPRVIARAK